MVLSCRIFFFFLVYTSKSYIINFGENQQFVLIIVNEYFYVCV